MARDAHVPQLERIRALSAGISAWTLERSPEFKARLMDLAEEEQISLLKAAVALMPTYRGTTSEDWATGSLLYAAAVQLYRAKPSVTEADLCEILAAADHDCGHGGDTQASLDLAIDYMLRRGYTPALGTAIAQLVANLPSSNAVQVQLLRRRANLLSVLTPWPAPANGKPMPWIDTVGHRIAELDEHEQSQWQRLVLQMKLAEQHRVSARWRKVASAFVEALGTDRVLGRLREFWPEPGSRVCLERSGAQILKHFIWSLSVLPREEGEPLACAVATMTWDRPKPPMAVLKPAVLYLAESGSAEAVRARESIQATIASV